MKETVPYKSTTEESWAWFFNLLRVFADTGVLMLFWGWFVAPLGAVAIDYREAFGLRLLLGLYGLMTHKPYSAWLSRRAQREDQHLSPSGACLANYIALGLLLGVGALVHFVRIA